MRDQARRLLRRAKYAVGSHPIGLPLLVRLTPEGADRIVDAHTDLVIEGFPRSGNTFAVFAVRHANPGIRIASHIHHVAQLKRAVALGRPTVVLVREPVACLSSYLLAGPHGLPAGVVEEYIGYHRTVESLLDQHGAALALLTFESVTGSMERVVGQINAHFGTALSAFSGSKEDTAAVFEAIAAKHTEFPGASRWSNGVARPEASRADLQAAQVERLLAPELAPRLAEAAALHKRLSVRALI